MTSLEFPITVAPKAGIRQTIRPGIDWIQLPLPFALNHVNCWLLHDNDHSCIVDAGLNTSKARQCWQSILAETGWPDELLVTHFHPDHSGLAGWFANGGSKVISNKVEWGIVERLHAFSDSDYQKIYVDWYAQHGIADSYISGVKSRGNSYAMGVCEPPKVTRFLADGDEIELGGRTYKVLTGKGHAPEMLMLYCEQDSILIAADQVLPNISPNVSLMPHSNDLNPLQSFLQSLEQLRALPAETLVLPSHGLPFIGLHQRIDQLLAHHDERLNDIVKALATKQSATDLFDVLFNRELDHQQLSFALGETLAHTKYLEEQGLVSKTTQDGIVHFLATS